MFLALTVLRSKRIGKSGARLGQIELAFAPDGLTIRHELEDFVTLSSCTPSTIGSFPSTFSVRVT